MLTKIKGDNMNWEISGTIRTLKIIGEHECEFRLNYKDIYDDKILIISEQDNPPIDGKLVKKADYIFTYKCEPSFLLSVFQNKLMLTLSFDEDNYKKLVDNIEPIIVNILEFNSEK